MSDHESTDRSVDEQVDTVSRIGRLFDVRLVIAGLLTLYGVILLIRGITDSSSAVAKAAGIRVNLWTGIAMLVVGLLFFLWIKLAPLRPPDEDELRDELSRGEDPAA